MLPRLSCLFQNILFKAKPALKSDNELFSQSFFKNSWMLYTRSISSEANSQKENENRPETENLETETQGGKVNINIEQFFVYYYYYYYF
ncbi:hypothetical protein CEXT_458351 [Caerostris extrusa]|uniref:Uncharacterized protein n=1 Tax=Caerostris extrusa TaxID=172846 RepID=A0AAV4S570_CAEEX|nr:hypothetical protein CEXT_458351 [Caerostris extrusa]